MDVEISSYAQFMQTLYPSTLILPTYLDQSPSWRSWHIIVSAKKLFKRKKADTILIPYYKTDHWVVIYVKANKASLYDPLGSNDFPSELKSWLKSIGVGNFEFSTFSTLKTLDAAKLHHSGIYILAAVKMLLLGGSSTVEDFLQELNSHLATV